MVQMQLTLLGGWGRRLPFIFAFRSAKGRPPLWRGSPDPAVCLTEGLEARARLGVLRSAPWQGRETLPQRCCSNIHNK